MAKKKLLGSVALSAGLLAGGTAGVVLGVPGVSGAQTTTVPDQPTTTVPEDGQTTPDRPGRGDRENCPDKDGTGDQAPAPSSTRTPRSAEDRAAGSNRPPRNGVARLRPARPGVPSR